MTYKKKLRVFTTLIFAILLMTFGTILSASNQQRTMAFSSVSTSITEMPSFSQSERCDESGQGTNSSSCTDIIFSSSSRSTSVSESGPDNASAIGSGEITVTPTADQQIECDESGPGDNNAGCLNVEQFHDFPSQTITGTASDNADIQQNNKAEQTFTMVQQLQCDESGPGDNNAACSNSASNSASSLQDSTATASGNGNIKQVNNIKLTQSQDQQLQCDESGPGDNLASCSNDATNQADSITQINTGTGNGNINQGNNANIIQTAKQQDECNESGPGDNTATCQNSATNIVGPVSQTNDATGDGSFAQNNDLKISQTEGQQNKCGGLGFGDNTATCQNAAISTVGAVSQTNGQSLEVNQNTEQNNHCNIDSVCSNTATEDVEGINSGSVSQDANQNNDCIFGSTCTNTASASVIDDGSNNGNANTNQEITQNNLCMFNSNCANDGSATGTTSSSNTQSNKCFINSDCHNTGVNNNTVCIAGSNCDNSGTDSQVIGVAADDCSSSDTGRTVCIGSLRFGDSSSTESSDSAVTPTTATNPVQKTSTSDSVPEGQQQQQRQNALPIIDNGNTNNNNDAKFIPVSRGVTTTTTHTASTTSSASTHSSDVSNQAPTPDKNKIAATTISKDGNVDNNKQKVNTLLDTRTNHHGDNNAAANIDNGNDGSNKDDNMKSNGNGVSKKDHSDDVKIHDSITSNIGHSGSSKDHNTAKVHDNNGDTKKDESKKSNDNGGSKKDDNTAARIDHAKKGNDKKDHSNKDDNTAAKIHDSITSKIGHSGSKKGNDESS